MTLFFLFFGLLKFLSNTMLGRCVLDQYLKKKNVDNCQEK